eukprot:4612804-Prymnesium_polylepis.2
MEAYSEAQEHASKQHDPLADLVQALVSDSWRAFKRAASWVGGTVCEYLTRSRNLQLSSTSRANLRFHKDKRVGDTRSNSHPHPRPKNYESQGRQSAPHAALGGRQPPALRVAERPRT